MTRRALTAILLVAAAAATATSQERPLRGFTDDQAATALGRVTARQGTSAQ